MLLLITCLLLLGVYSTATVIRVSGRVGGSAEIRCPYDAGYETYSKYLCRGDCSYRNKYKPVETEERKTGAVRGRFSLHDNTTSRIFSVTITGLTVEDAGKYWCGVKTGFGSKDVYTEVELTVKVFSTVTSTSALPFRPTMSTIPESINSTPLSAMRTSYHHSHSIPQTSRQSNQTGSSIEAGPSIEALPHSLYGGIAVGCLVLLIIVVLGLYGKSRCSGRPKSGFSRVRNPCSDERRSYITVVADSAPTSWPSGSGQKEQGPVYMNTHR
ncbi:CMRF35-like molecule 6 [Engraulis encrasicolus]|uniref:CMRF35-like molecule 6 n=1 Tax=Engraulis encrasicolus TaxID=184585 RepID=UPI002FCF4E7B